MELISYSLQQLQSIFTPVIYKKGQILAQQGAVVQLFYQSSNEWYDCFEIHAKVQDEQQIQQVHLEFFIRDEKDRGQVNFPYKVHGRCSCSYRAEGCVHVSSTLFALRTVLASGKSADELQVDSWLQFLHAETSIPVVTNVDSTYELFFELVIPDIMDDDYVALTPKLYRRLKNGSLGAEKHWNSRDVHNRHFTPQDKEFIVSLEVMDRLCTKNNNFYHYYNESYSLDLAQGSALLEQIVLAGKTHQAKKKEQIISLGKPLDLKIQWKETKEQKHVLHLSAAGKKTNFFFLDDLWYFDKKTATLGRVNTSLSQSALINLLSMPPIPKKYSIKVNNAFATQAQFTNIPTLSVAKEQEEECMPIPHIYLHSLSLNAPEASGEIKDKGKTPALALSFQYENKLVAWHEEQAWVDVEHEGISRQIYRNSAMEAVALKLLAKSGLRLLVSTPFVANNQQHRHVYLFGEYSPFDFWQSVVPVLVEQQWIVQVDEHYEHRIVDEAHQEWYADIQDGETSDWFSFELGVVVQGEKINLLPIVQNLLQQMESNKQLEQIKENIVYAKLPNNHYLPIPGERLYGMMQTLLELFDKKSLTQNETLILSKSEAARLLEIEKALGAAKLRWLNNHKMHALAEKIAEFKSITTVNPPQGLNATLRPYQQEGVNWMQFLREYELAGILADDMGLGKTIQALSHILLEKESGRMTAPALVIAPTSLMYNWDQECKRFAPDLKVLVLHGASRKAHLNSLSDYDLLLTTYPLILRDKEFLLQHVFHLLILDEAQYIKNHKSLSAQIIMQIKAQHRLCLTGTPMENHLGELWSLFHFLMPGLLGDQTTFTRRYSTPIEKHGDNERRQVLSRRIAPFLLRRTKSEVVKELPPKIETISYVELEQGQRDLYETVRIAMEEKVRSEIAKLGLARSHIIILDALLKLRQICCDPKLLKSEHKNNADLGSCKMNLLKDMLPELIEEGRRVLIFSSFTQMLDIIEQTVNELKIGYVRLTGATKDRKTPIERFQNLEVPLFLISLKAGGTGLNLTAADTVIHVDPWWNPAAENQATDRAHRIGQDKTVFVYKIVTKGTVEEKILEMQQRKQALADSIFSDKTTEKSKLTENDLQVLFSAF